MKNRHKKIVLGLTACISAVCGVIGFASLRGYKNIETYAENATMSIDTLGNLSWADIEGANSYNWSYTIGAETSSIYTTEKNTVNVGIALTKAAQSAIAGNNADDDTTNDAQANVQFHVTPVGTDAATTMTYTYTFSQYIDYGYATHDFSDIKAQAASATKLSELTLDGSLAGWVSSAMFKNDILTMGVRANEAFGERGLDLGLFGKYYIDDNKISVYNYRIMTGMDGSISLGLTCNYGAAWYKTYDSSTTYNAPLETGKSYYLSIAVFDTYDVTGAVIGETVYFARSEYDANADELVEVGGFTEFIPSATVEAQNISYKDSYQLNSSTSYKKMEVDRSGMYIAAKGAESSTYVFSGIPSYVALEAPTGVYYDNADGSFNWNKVKGATAYEWRIGDGAWTETGVRKVNVETYLSEYENLGYVPFSVRAKEGKTARYHLDLTRFFGARSVVRDYVDLGKAGKKAAGDEKKVVNWPTTLSGSYGPANYYYNDTGLALGTHVTFKMKVTATASYSTKIAGLGLYGKDGSVNYNRYFLNLYGDGTVQLGNAVTRWNTNVSDRPKSKYFRVINVADGFALGKIYYVTYGLDDVYEDGVKVAERFTVRIELEEEGGLSRRTIGLISCDNEQFATDGYAIDMKPTIQGDTSSSYVVWYRAKDSATQTINFTSEGETLATKTVAYGEYYDFTDVASPACPEGYDEFLGWTYVTAKGAEKNFCLEGTYNVTTSVLEVQPKFRPKVYNVTYDKVSGNSATYTVESTEMLKAPTEIPEGKMFDAWYEASDVNYENPITVLTGRMGDLSLVARFVDKYTVTVIDENGMSVYDYKVGGTETHSLVAGTTENKTFVGWQVWNGNEYVDYDGDTVFVPTASLKFKAIYEWTVYSITYNAAGATHTNTNTYTVNTPLTFTAAEKAGAFFLGWYLEPSFVTKVADTATFTGEITLYAKFAEHGLPATVVEIDRSKTEKALPVPELPLGASYQVHLSKGGTDIPVVDNEYAFEQAGDYLLTYEVLFADGNQVIYEVVYAVREVYVLHVHYGDGNTMIIQKAANETLSAEELPTVQEGKKFDGLYLDSAYQQPYDLAAVISDDMDIYVKWVPITLTVVPEDAPIEEPDETPDDSTSEEHEDSTGASDSADVDPDVGMSTEKSDGNQAVTAILGALGGFALGSIAIAVYFLIDKKRKGVQKNEKKDKE